MIIIAINLVLCFIFERYFHLVAIPDDLKNITLKLLNIHK